MSIDFHLPWLRRTTLLCLVLLCVSGVAQALHSHNQDLARGDADKTRCTICVAGHSPQQTPASIHVLPSEAREFAAQSQRSAAIKLIVGEASRIRPPPSL